MKSVQTDNAPAAIGPYSQAVVCDDYVFTSGQIPIDPSTSLICGDSVEEQTARVCENIKGVLNAAGTGMDRVVKTVCFLSDMGDFASFNSVYEKYFKTKPARSCVAVKDIPKGALVEIEAIARL